MDDEDFNRHMRILARTMVANNIARVEQRNYYQDGEETDSSQGIFIWEYEAERDRWVSRVPPNTNHLNQPLSGNNPGMTIRDAVEQLMEDAINELTPEATSSDAYCGTVTLTVMARRNGQASWELYESYKVLADGDNDVSDSGTIDITEHNNEGEDEELYA